MHRKWMALVIPLAAVGALLPMGTAQATGRPQVRPIEWRACGTGAECGEVQVPLDWARPGGEKITVAVSRVRATDQARRLGVVLFNPGGPGGPGTPVVREFAAQVFPADLRARFDIVGFDPRGVGDSRPAITCPVPPTSPSVTQFPATGAEFDRLVAYNRRVARGCRDATGPLIDHVDTVSAARDIDVLRQALGESRVNWLGLSYGSLLGATYAGLYPDRVRAMVLDGAVDHTIGTRRMVVDETRSTEDVFTRFVAWCDAEPSCALHGQDVAARYRALLDGGAQDATPDEVGFGAYTLLNLPSYWPQLAEAIRDRTGFAGEESSAAYRVIGCHDFPSDIRTFGDLRSRMTAVRALAPKTRGYVEAWDVQAGCAGWPIPAANPWGPTPVRGAPPILVVSGEHDPATPLVWGTGMASQIACSRHLVWSGVGHTGFLNDGPTQQKEVDYLISP
ncbi:alpha/beta hydrolase [Actinokineospora globicatena]|uniref:alpha/beta hydrolase n=1 Tax=Actinokineospora globicatena TaxID=103729 RepID=UPI0020A2729E|nr:alpha/beta hydrolase [Actinokineospora globicatena]